MDLACSFYGGGGEIVDFCGGESTRNRTRPIEDDEEQAHRVMPVVEGLARQGVGASKRVALLWARPMSQTQAGIVMTCRLRDDLT